MPVKVPQSMVANTLPPIDSACGPVEVQAGLRPGRSQDLIGNAAHHMSDGTDASLLVSGTSRRPAGGQQLP